MVLTTLTVDDLEESFEIDDGVTLPEEILYALINHGDMSGEMRSALETKMEAAIIEVRISKDDKFLGIMELAGMLQDGERSIAAIAFDGVAHVRVRAPRMQPQMQAELPVVDAHGVEVMKLTLPESASCQLLFDALTHEFTGDMSLVTVYMPAKGGEQCLPVTGLSADTNLLDIVAENVSKLLPFLQPPKVETLSKLTVALPEGSMRKVCYSSAQTQLLLGKAWGLMSTLPRRGGCCGGPIPS